jgi:hypothetical protein
MARLRKAFEFMAATTRFLVRCVHYVQRRRTSEQQRPRLRLDFIHPPYWGAESLDFAISNSGGRGARNCRYCRLQAFTMAGPVGRPPAFSARRWYGSESLEVPSGSQKRASAALTLSPYPRDILGDMVAASEDGIAYHDAIVCQDSAGTAYRFRCHLGPDAAPDVWSAGLFDRFRGVSPPAWVAWVAEPSPVERVRWSDVK